MHKDQVLAVALLVAAWATAVLLLYTLVWRS